MGYRIGAAIAVALSILTSVAGAQDIQLQSLDGTVELEGNLIAYDGAYYQIDTYYGTLTVAAEGVTCAGPGCPDLGSFVAEARISGAATVADGVLPALLQAFADSQNMEMSTEVEGPVTTFILRRTDGSAAARFTLDAGTTDSGLLALLNEEADIALALRTPTTAELRAAEAMSPDDPPLNDRVRVLALDALVPLVSRDNPIDTLTLPQIARLFSGEIVNWNVLGGPDAPIALHMLEPGLGLAQSFSARILTPLEADLDADVIRHGSVEALAEAVAQDAYAIGIAARSGVGPARAVPLSASCGLAQSATDDAIKAEDYPLTAPIYMYLAPRRLPLLVRQFLAFTQTDAAEREVRDAGYVDQLLTRTPMALQGERLASAISAGGGDVVLADLQDVIDVLGTAERLSTTLRFNPGGTELDIQSRASIARLANMVERGAFDGRRVIFAGFSDGDGPAGVNTRLSLRRADAVRDAFVAAAGSAASERVTVEVHGFGEAMPMACDDTEWGRAVNRRVEVWLD
jgi:phosphate transport system substrate-binding protein